MRSLFMSSSRSTAFSLRWLVPLTAAGALAVGCGGSDGGDVAGGTGGASAQDASAGGEGGSSLAGQGGGDLGGSGGSAATGGEGGQAGSAGAGLDGGLDGSGDAAEDAKPDVFMGCPNIGDTKCEAGTVQTCQSDGAGGQDWKTTEFCSVDNSECKVVNGKASCVAAPTCKDGVKNQDETGKDCGGTHCDPCPSGEGCVSNGDCESDACANNQCMVCKAGTVRCDCGAVKQCNAQQTGWSTVRKCSASQMCDPDAATCTGQKTVGTNKVTGHYYMYAVFTPSNSPLKSGCYGADSFVDSKGVNWIYINRSGNLDRYQVTIEDSDHDGKVDPNQHPHNPKDTGPMEKRTLIYKDTIHASFGTPHSTGLYATEDAVYYEMNGSVKKFDPKTHQTSTVVSTNSIAIEVFGYDSLSKQWFGGQRSRQVYSLCPGKSTWQYEMSYPNMGGSHQDGMEIVTNPKDGISYMYVSDMTSDYILQYYRDAKKNKWTQKNVFQYTDSASQPVEGMGFGAFNHFWISSGNSLYELGGGELQEYVEPG